jgi:hypothetical protein
VKWFLTFHQIKKSMLHSNKRRRARKRKREIRDLITLLRITIIICLTLTTSPRYPLVTPPPLRFDGTDYTKWSYSMRMHLISLGPSVWNIVRVGVDFLKKDEELDFEQLQQIHRNA